VIRNFSSFWLAVREFNRYWLSQFVIKMGKTETTVHSRVITYLFKSNLFEIKNWSLHSSAGYHFKSDFNDCFCAVYMDRGTLTKKDYELTTGQVTLERPRFEYQLLPSNGSCTIINFSDNFYDQADEELGISKLFKNFGKDILSVKGTAPPEAELALLTLKSIIPQDDKLRIDDLVIDIFKELLKRPWALPVLSQLHYPQHRHHREAIEHAKEFICTNFAKEISLSDLSRNCGISPFYLSRLFKRYTTYSPHQYLNDIRLKYGEMLLKDTSLPIIDITFASGFTSPEYFSTLFRRKYDQSPTRYRQDKQNISRKNDGEQVI
jgi:AraC family transcriptional regulator